MKRRLALAALLLSLAACATPGRPGRMAPPHPRQLEAAIAQIRQGNTARAKTILNSIVDGAPVRGVTDEALFRLALLSIKPDQPGTSEQLLRRLKKEFPSSSWTLQAQPLLELMAGVDDLKKQNRSLKAGNRSLSRANDTLIKTNDSLGKNNDELKKQIDQLKHLDLELERKNK